MSSRRPRHWQEAAKFVHLTAKLFISLSQHLSGNTPPSRLRSFGHLGSDPLQGITHKEDEVCDSFGIVGKFHTNRSTLLLVFAPRCDHAWLLSYDAPFIMIVVGFLAHFDFGLLLEVWTATKLVNEKIFERERPSEGRILRAWRGRGSRRLTMIWMTSPRNSEIKIGEEWPGPVSRTYMYISRVILGLWGRTQIVTVRN